MTSLIREKFTKTYRSSSFLRKFYIYIYIHILFPRKGNKLEKGKKEKKKKIKEYPSNQALEAATIPISVRFCERNKREAFSHSETELEGMASPRFRSKIAQ